MVLSHLAAELIVEVVRTLSDAVDALDELLVRLISGAAVESTPEAIGSLREGREGGGRRTQIGIGARCMSQKRAKKMKHQRAATHSLTKRTCKWGCTNRVPSYGLRYLLAYDRPCAAPSTLLPPLNPCSSVDKVTAKSKPFGHPSEVAPLGASSPPLLPGQTVFSTSTLSAVFISASAHSTTAFMKS